MSVYVLLTIAFAATHQTALCSSAVLDIVKAECNSRYYCNSSSIKYMSLSQLNGSYLNGTIIARNKTTTIANCETLCMRTSGCFSINIDISLSNDLDCQLLSSNLYVQRALLIRNPNFIHLFIKSPSCEKKKCQNDAICIPSYANDSYSCQCIRNATFHSWGKHCENLARGIQAANHLFAFDNATGNNIYPISKGESTDNYYLQLLNDNIGNKILRVPGRQSPVAYCKSATTGGCLEICKKLAGLNNLRGCEAGVTHSIWLKFTKEELDKNKASMIFANTNVGPNSGVIFHAQQNRRDGYKYIIASGTRKWQLTFARNVSALQWTHFAITFHNNVGICGYVNGILDKCGGSSLEQNSNLADNSCFRLGFSSTSGPTSGVFLDDFAVWLSALNQSDIKEVYYHGKAMGKA